MIIMIILKINLDIIILIISMILFTSLIFFLAILMIILLKYPNYNNIIKFISVIFYCIQSDDDN